MNDISNDTKPQRDYIPLSDVSTLFPEYKRPEDYLGEVCWQYHIRRRNLLEDIARSTLPEEYLRMMVCSFVDDELLKFAYVDKTDKLQCKEISAFIERHEWLGRLPNRPTHRFTARTQEGGELCGVIIMAVPNTFSSLLGKDYRDREKLVSRGASISWAPRNTASWLLMNSIRWMSKNTCFCLFTAYSDPEARELGTIYQSCNWMYLGQTSGTDKQYFDPARSDLGWFSDRNFRHKSKVKKHAKELGITLEKSWWKKGDYSLDWTLVPTEIRLVLKQAEKAHRERCTERLTPAKHKYAYIMAQNAPATRILRKRFAQLHPEWVNLPYPKTRGG